MEGRSKARVSHEQKMLEAIRNIVKAAAESVRAVGAYAQGQQELWKRRSMNNHRAKLWRREWQLITEQSYSLDVRKFAMWFLLEGHTRSQEVHEEDQSPR